MQSKHNLARSSSSQTSLAAAALSLFLRLGRITKYTGSWKGHNTLLRLYRKYLPQDLRLRVNDIDGDLKFDVNMRGDLDICLWHFPELYEKEERESFCSLIEAGCVVLDVGANIGLYTLLAAKRGARVFAIEADPANVALLRHHVAINGFSDQVTIFAMAATDCPKEVSLYRHAFNQGASNIIQRGSPAGTVPGKTVDSLNLPRVDVCKMDIEGAELIALLGMDRTLERSPNIKLFVEYAEIFGNSEDLLSYLRANFSTLKVLETSQMDASGRIPPFCNVLATR
jgi:FkbM family methyltransferase